MEKWQLSAQRMVKDLCICFDFCSPTWKSEEEEKKNLDSVQEVLYCFVEMYLYSLHQVILLLTHFRVCVLQGLTSHTADTYETIKMDKKPIVWWRFGAERMLSPETPELNLLKLYTV